MDSKDTMHCDLCNFAMHKNNWNSHIIGKKHCSMQEKIKRKRTLLVRSGK